MEKKKEEKSDIYREIYETVTFVIPSYKNVSTLRRALNSIVKQPLFEKYHGKIIVSEDISTMHDKIEVVINEFQNYDLTYVVNDPAKGMTGNWNNCIKLAQTPYVIMLHDDDYLYPNYIEALEIIFESKLKFDIVAFDNVVIVDDKDGVVCKKNKNIKTSIKNWFDQFKQNKIRKIYPSDYYFGGLNGKMIPSCGIIYRKQFMLDKNGYSDKDGYSVDEIFIEKNSGSADIYFLNTTVGVHTYTTNTNLSSTLTVKRCFIMEAQKHHLEMKKWYAKIINKLFWRGMYFSFMYPWHQELFPEYEVTKRADVERRIFSLICRFYIYLSALINYRKINETTNSSVMLEKIHD